MLRSFSASARPPERKRGAPQAVSVSGAGTSTDRHVLAAHADWSVAPGKRWMAVAVPARGRWLVRVEAVGPVATLLSRLREQAAGMPVALGVDVPIGLPRRYAAAHLPACSGFPAFLDQLGALPGFFDVCDTIDQLRPGRPFYPRRPQRGMTRRAHALALGLADTACLYRACDRATADRPAGAPLFWTLGPNQAGKAALSAWREVILPARAGLHPPALWPFEGRLGTLLRPGVAVIAETYPAEALRQLGLRMPGSKRRRADRQAMAAPLHAAMARLHAAPDTRLAAWLADGFGTDPAGEDRIDCLLGLLCLLQVVRGERTDCPPDDPWIRRWEGWVLGQEPASPRLARSLPSHPVSVHDCEMLG